MKQHKTRQQTRIQQQASQSIFVCFLAGIFLATSGVMMSHPTSSMPFVFGCCATGILLACSIIAYARPRGFFGMIVAIVMGVVFVVFEGFELAHSLKSTVGSGNRAAITIGGAIFGALCIYVLYGRARDGWRGVD